MPGNNAEESIQHLEHGESLKSSIQDVLHIRKKQQIIYLSLIIIFYLFFSFLCIIQSLSVNIKAFQNRSMT